MIVITVMSETVFKEIPTEIRKKFSSINFKEEDEYETNKEDKLYCQLYKEYKKAKNKKEEYLFKKRHKI